MQTMRTYRGKSSVIQMRFCSPSFGATAHVTTHVAPACSSTVTMITNTH